MKKFCVYIAVILLLFLSYPFQGKAAGMTHFSVNAGVLTDKNFDLFYWTAGAAIDIHLGNILMISPEGFVMGYKFDFDYFLGFAGGTGNVTFGKRGSQFFLGAGPLIAFPINWSGDTALVLKLQGGVISGPLRLTVYAMTDWEDPFSGMALGATLGLRF
jgi:hypothetical protein